MKKEDLAYKREYIYTIKSTPTGKVEGLQKMTTTVDFPVSPVIAHKQIDSMVPVVRKMREEGSTELEIMHAIEMAYPHRSVFRLYAAVNKKLNPSASNKTNANKTANEIMKIMIDLSSGMTDKRKRSRFVNVMMKAALELYGYNSDGIIATRYVNKIQSGFKLTDTKINKPLADQLGGIIESSDKEKKNKKKEN